MATIKDVAALAQVSIKSVSRVLNGEPHVRPQLAQKVRAAVETLNYTPNQSARRLAGGRSFLLAFLYNNPNPSYVAAIQKGAALRSRELGYHLLVEPMELEGDERLTTLKKLVATLRPDGAFLIPPLSDDKVLLEELAALGVATVRIAGTIAADGANLVTPERQGGVLAAEHLIELGHRKIAIIKPPASHAAALERVEGYLDAMKRAEIAVNGCWVREGRFDFRSGLDATGDLLDAADPPTAIIAANDEMALGAMMAAHVRGLSVPEDLSVVGFDDTPASETAWPPLTTVRQPLEEMGRDVVDRLTRFEVGAASRLDFKLIVRQSTAPPKSTT